MRHIVIMPEDCYKADSGRFKGCIVRRSSAGVEIQAGFNEVRYIVDVDCSPEEIEHVWLHHTCDAVITPDGKISYIPKAQKFKMVEYE